MVGHTVDVLLETFTWVGFLGAVAVGVVWLILLLADGTWTPAHAVIEPGENGRVAHWFTAEGGVGRAVLSDADEAHLVGADEAAIYYRAGTDDRMRFVARSPLVRLTGWFTVGLFAVGVLAVVLSLVTMFTA
ncbi:hypothetical protein [Microbacterium sp. SORGH_AS_0862]|uniref:hypothetical protein n=1 Tax=Microbacterium sp. SORGH_AS_0862 TaxID=3041789 RepID=UPI002792379D|nr:hypothetical protein [Microbacterium sp. SORGH_AS_0862]MDQ1206054.1 hypothetical protein [Microbacterium sp. SORGH_AS_0862]